MFEEWRAIPGFSAYEVSNEGRIRRIKPERATTVGHIIALQTMKTGYRWVSVARDGGKRASLMVHVAVALAFIGPRPERHEVNHKDGIKANNIPANIEWVTHPQNMAHAVQHGLFVGKRPVGERHGRARLTEDRVREARMLVEKGVTVTVLSKRFGVDRTAIYQAVTRRTWRHVV